MTAVSFVFGRVARRSIFRLPEFPHNPGMNMPTAVQAGHPAEGRNIERMIKMGWPQIFILGWALVGLLLGAYKHGKPREGEYKFSDALLGWAIIMIPLWFGGFWG